MTAFIQDRSIVIQTIRIEVKRLNKLFKDYEDIGPGLETQINLNFAKDELKLYYSLNSDWSVSIKETVQKTILRSAAKYPGIIIMSTPLE